MRPLCRCLLVVALLFAIAVPVAAQSKPKYLDKETFFQMESVSNPQISPDGTQIVFSRGFVDLMKDQNASNLWVIDTKGERLRQLTEGTWRDSAPAWSPDGRRIAFLSDRSGSTQVHVMWADTRETAQLTRVDRAPAGLKWSPDGKWLLFTTGIPDETPLLPVKLPPTLRGAQLARGAVIVDRLSWGRDGTGPTEKGYTHVFIVDATVGGTPRQVTDGKYNHSDPEWAPDGQKLKYFLSPDQLVIRSKDGREHRLLSPMVQTRRTIWSADGKFLLCSGVGKDGKHGWGTFPRLSMSGSSMQGRLLLQENISCPLLTSGVNMI